MQEYVIKNQMASLTYEEKKVFIKGLLKNAKETKRANEINAAVKRGAFPMALLGGITAFMGVTSLGLVAFGSGIPEVAELASQLKAVGGFAIISGALALLRSEVKNKRPNEEAECAEQLSLAAKKDIEMLKKMYKNLDKGESRE